MSKYLIFDIETAKVMPLDVDPLTRRPLGITCIATAETGCENARTWYSRNADGSPADEMSRADAIDFVRMLQERTAAGDKVVTWNGLRFDFLVLMDASGLVEECKELARHHIDMMFQVYRIKGMRVGLARAARGMGVTPKSTEISGADAPQLWRDGQYETVLRYVSGDAITTLELAEKLRGPGNELQWTSADGVELTCPIDGWLTVDEALGLPDPDDPRMPLSAFTGWFDG